MEKLVVTGKGKPYDTKSAWYTALGKANISGLRFHDLRHEAGLSDLEVASISGHKSMQMLKRYTHLRTENLSGKIANI